MPLKKKPNKTKPNQPKRQWRSFLWHKNTSFHITLITLATKIEAIRLPVYLSFLHLKWDLLWVLTFLYISEFGRKNNYFKNRLQRKNILFSHQIYSECWKGENQILVLNNIYHITNTNTTTINEKKKRKRKKTRTEVFFSPFICFYFYFIVSVSYGCDEIILNRCNGWRVGLCPQNEQIWNPVTLLSFV